MRAVRVNQNNKIPDRKTKAMILSHSHLTHFVSAGVCMFFFFFSFKNLLDTVINMNEGLGADYVWINTPTLAQCSEAL